MKNGENKPDQKNNTRGFVHIVTCGNLCCMDRNNTAMQACSKVNDDLDLNPQMSNEEAHQKYKKYMFEIQEKKGQVLYLNFH